MKANSGLKKNRTKIQMVLTALVILSVVRQFFLGNYHNMFLGILTLILFMVPQFLDRKLNVTIPPGLETVILIFIFSAEILGEINAFYVKIPIWDTILHTTNGFLMAAIGFALIDLFNRSDRFSIKMSPYFVAFFAFCFSISKEKKEIGACILGVLEGLAGIILLFSGIQRFITDVMAAYMVGAIILIYGIFQIAAGTKVYKTSKGKGILSIVCGVLSVIVSIISFTHPILTMISAGYMIAFSVLMQGINMIVLGINFGKTEN